MVDPRIASRLNEWEGKWVLIHPTTTRSKEFYDLATDLSQRKNLVNAFNASRSFPEYHPQGARVQAMSQSLLEHDQAGEPRTTAPLGATVNL